MAGFLEALEPLVELAESTAEPQTTCAAAMEAAAAGDVDALVRVLGDERFSRPALRYAGVLDADGQLTDTARDQLVRVQTLVAGRDSLARADRWDGVMTVPPYLKDAVRAYGVRETVEVLRDLFSGASARIVMASPFLDKGFHELIPEVAGFVARGGEFLLLTRGILVSEHNAGIVRELRRRCGNTGKLDVVSWEEEGLGLHMKALVADSSRAYVGSANFTWYGMTQQAELGTLLEGPSVIGLERLLDSLADVIRKRKRVRAR
ncbi:MAG: phospholipase D-like domain-containing protein [Actinomycetota bacterium]|nr:phospholipase D-like domain-containing protein [Actinomycetota bacterium]